MIMRESKVRIAVLFLIFCCLFFIIIATLFNIQIRQKQFFNRLGSQQYQLSVIQTPPRAPILDRYGNKLVINRQAISAFLVPHLVEDEKLVMQFLTAHFPAALERFKTKKDKNFIFIKRRINQSEANLIKQINLPCLQLIYESSRFYPVPSTASIIGITDIDNNGIMGLELTFQEHLAGKPSSFLIERDARSGAFYFEKKEKKIGHSGKPLQITLDATLQFLVEEEVAATMEKFQAKQGAAIILDPATGELLAMVSLPRFDPNQTEKIDLATTHNRALTDCYELGSVIKVFAALAALQEGVVTPDELIDCRNSKTAIIDGRVINTTKAAGVIPFRDVIAQSNNIGIAIVAKRIGKKLYDHYRALGFGKKTGIELPGEQKGFVNHPDNWSKQSIISLSYGYEITATLMQLARAFALIANDGHAIDLHLIADGKPHQPDEKALYKKEAIAEIKKILEATTAHGTAKRAQMKGYTVRAKTGTANILEEGKYNPDRNIYTCAGIVEKGDYQRVIVVFINQAAQKNLYAATVTAPLFEQIAERMVIHERII